MTARVVTCLVGVALAVETVAPSEASAEWRPVKQLAVKRFRHAAAALADGTVLVTGGHDGGMEADALASAEVWSPAGKTWTQVSPMSVPRVEHTATVLADGRVLVAGGMDAYSGGAGQTSAEIYDPATKQWTATGSMSVGRTGHAAVKLADGRVLVAGGGQSTTVDGEVGDATAEVWDPRTGAWRRISPMLAARHEHTLTLLRDGRVLVVGSSPGAEVYDPAGNRWTKAGPMAHPRSRHTATLLADGRVLVAGGVPFDRCMIKAVEVFDPATRAFSAAGELSEGRWDHEAALLSDESVIVVGGGTWESAPAGWYQTGSRGDCTGFFMPAQALRTTEVFEPTKGVWKRGPALRQKRMDFTLTPTVGRLIAAGGLWTFGIRESDARRTVELFVP